MQRAFSSLKTIRMGMVRLKGSRERLEIICIVHNKMREK